MGKCQRPTIIARIHVMRPQTAERAQQIFSIAESSGNYQGIAPSRCRLGYGAGGIVQRYSQCGMKPNFVPEIAAADQVQPCKCALDALPALDQKRQLDQ